MVVIGKSLLIFSEVTFKMAAWWPYWIFWFPDSNFSLALNINSKLKWHNTYHGSHRPGKVMEFNPWLEKSLNFMFTWKNGILPGKVIENQWKSLKNLMCHVKLNLNMKTLMIIWLKVSLCHYIWDQIGETMLADLHSRASCYIVADSWTTCYITHSHSLS